MKTEFYAEFFCTHAPEIFLDAWWSLVFPNKSTIPGIIVNLPNSFSKRSFQKFWCVHRIAVA